MNINNNLIKLAQEFKKNGSTLYIVGGFVRDNLMNYESSDIDICASLEPAQVISICKKLKYGTHSINRKLGTVLISTKTSNFEYTTFRKENYNVNGEHTPSQVDFVDDMATDSKRRDFTINSIYFDILTNKIIDLYGGIDDINHKVIKTILTPDIVFSCDGLRILRMIRFSSTFGFVVENKTLLESIMQTKLLRDISAERKLKELQLIVCADLKHNTKPNFVKYFNKLNIYKYLFKTNKFSIKLNKYYKQFILAKEENRYLAFCMLLLLNKYHFKHISQTQVYYDVNNIWGADGLKDSTMNIDNIYKSYLVLQNFLNTTKHNILDYVLYNSLSTYGKLALSSYIDSNCIEEQINKFRLQNIPMQSSELNITNKELVGIIKPTNIAKVKLALFNMCLSGKIKNEHNELLQHAKAINKSYN